MPSAEIRFRKRLSFKIFLLVITGALFSVMTIGSFAFLFTKWALQQSIMDQQMGLAKQTLNKIDRLLYERLIDIQQISGEEAIEDFLIGRHEGDAFPDPVLQKRLRTRMNQLAVVTGPWDVLFVVDKNGKIVLSADEMLLGDSIRNYPYKAIAYDASIQGVVYHSDLVISKDTGLPAIVISAPVRDEESRSIIGVVVGNFSWPAVMEILSEVPAWATLLNHEGKVIGNAEAMSRPNLIVESLKGGAAFPQLTGERSKSMISSKGEGILPEESLVSIAVQGGYLSYNGSGWRLVLAAPVTEVFAPATRAATQLVYLLIPLLMAAPLVILLVIRQMVVRPIRGLNRAIHAMASGDFTQRVLLKSEDEIGTLADSFNTMAKKLHNVYGSLETKVKERTKELETAKLAALNMMQDAEAARVKAESTAAQLQKEMAERKKIENQLLQSQKMETVGTLAGGIAHDLNNQLTPVKGYIDLILSDTRPDDPNYPLLQEANIAVERCTEVVQRLLGFSRSSNQTKTILSVDKMFRNLKGLISKFLPATILVEMVCPENIYPIEANETEIGTVIMNLAANARDAMADGGKLRFEAKNIELIGPGSKEDRRSGPFILLSVEDSGMGIPPDVLKRIFEPFFTTKDKGRGTGLGLAMVFKIVHEYGGWVDVSTKVGKGTVFQIYLPGRPGAPLSSPKAAETDLAGLLAKGENVLFADDEDIIRKMGQMLLEKMGYRVRVCSDAQEVVDTYAQLHAGIDLIVTDMTMPKLSGKQMIQKILEINPKARIIVASGYASEDNHQEILKMGAADFVQKPYTIFSLAKSLRTVLNRT